MKKVTIGVGWFAGALLAVAVAQAQQSPAGAGGEAGAAGAAQQQTLPPPQQGASGAAENQIYQPGAPREQAGQFFPPEQPGTETRQNVITPGNRFGQQRGLNYQGGLADPMPTPAERQAQGLDSTTQGGQQPGQPGTMGAAQRDGNQRGELGVWLAASAGPGVEIRQVTEGSAADEIGLEPGDVLLQVNRRDVSSPREVQQMIRSIPAGQTATLEVWRDGNQQEVSVTLQPMRESYRSGYRGGGFDTPRSGDLESRTMRLEEQLTMVMRELEQLRGEMRQLQSGSGPGAAESAASFEEPAAQGSASPFDAAEPGTTGAQPAESEESPFGPQIDDLNGQSATAQPGTTEPTTTEPAAEPGATETGSATEEPAERPAEEPATNEAADDLFGGTATESDTEEAPAQEEETEGQTDTDSLFQ